MFYCVLSLSGEDIIFWFVAAVNSKRYDRRFTRGISFDLYGHIFFLSLYKNIFWKKDKWLRRTNTDLFNRGTKFWLRDTETMVLCGPYLLKKKLKVKKWPTSILCIGAPSGQWSFDLIMKLVTLYFWKYKMDCVWHRRGWARGKSVLVYNNFNNHMVQILRACGVWPT